MDFVDRDSGQNKATTLPKHDLGEGTVWGEKGGKNKRTMMRGEDKYY